jgi:hypothetical protein
MINAFVLNQDRFAATEHVAGIRSLPEGQNHAFVFGVETPAASCSAVGIVRGFDGSVV